MNNPFLTSIIGLSAACVMGFLGAKLGAYFAKRRIEKSPTESEPDESSEIVAQRITVPFSQEQIDSLNAYQVSRNFHPFTCPEKHYRVIREHEVLSEEQVLSLEETQEFYILGDHVILVATEDGWHCPTQMCEYTQDWAWNFMANGSWRAMTTELGFSEIV